MSRQFWLVMVVVAISVTAICATFEPVQKSAPEIHNQTNTTLGSPKSTKNFSLKSKKQINLTITNRPKTDDIVRNSDSRYNKTPADHLNDVSSNYTEKDDDDYYYDYDDYSYDEGSSENKSTTMSNSVEDIQKSTTTAPKTVSITNDQAPELKPIKGDDKAPLEFNYEQSLDNTNDHLNDDDDDINDDDDDDDDKEENDEDAAEGDEIDFNKDLPCPRDCVCAKNFNGYTLATCSRLDADKQKFDSSVNDLIVADVGPKYPILLGPEIFSKMGLQYVSTIKITNCTIEYMHEKAFHGLNELYSVSLINVGLTIISPNTFIENKKIRIVTIAGNDLSVMSNVHYLLKSESIEELDISRNNLNELKPSAFSQLSNIVYINLSQNNLANLPEGLFDSSETLEELDLSYNSLKDLPEGFFNRTVLGILHLKYNEFTNNLNFGATDLQQLDLSYCSIKQIHHGMFDEMKSLTNLNLKGNGITKIQPDSFLQLKYLRHIDLSYNDLDQVSSLLFYKNTELDVIRLNENPYLSQLPTDGFQSYNGFFTVYLLDVSNCAIGALGHKTFSTMPHLVTLKLAWNNINNLGRETFASLSKLTELDLSNNLIDKVDDLMFMNNNDVTKLNLAGNPIRKLPTRLFMPFNKLRELDVSECDLHSLLNDDTNGMSRQYKFFETLRSFNASANQIKKISTEDIKLFKSLRTLDLSMNPLKCNEEFKGMIIYATMKDIHPSKVPTMANLDTTTFTENVRPIPGWDQLAHEVCKHSPEAYKPKEQTLEDIKKDILKGDDVETKKLFYKDYSLGNKHDRKEDDRINRIGLEEKKKIEDTKLNEKKLTEDDIAEDTSMNEDKDSTNYEGDSEENDDSYDDEYEEKDNETDLNKSKVHDLGLHVKEVELLKETKDKFLLNKLLLDSDKDEDGEEDEDENEDNEDNEDDSEEIIIEHGHIYYSGYRFFIPILVIVTCVIVLLLAIGKIVSMMMRKRGERYRMALLASKNSIVYQKLSEEIIKPNLNKQPKVHRYSPINQV